MERAGAPQPGPISFHYHLIFWIEATGSNKSIVMLTPLPSTFIEGQSQATPPLSLH